MSQDHEHHEGHGHDGSPFIQHHYDDAQHQFDSGKLGVWFFLVQEILFFSGLFVAYILYRHHHPEIFAYAHHYLDVKWGAINTAVLIISSLTAAWAVRCAQLNQRRGLIACLSITIVCACGFLGIKYIEYTHKIHEKILFGKRFDPCVASGGKHLLNRGNNCPGTKSSVQWDAAAHKPASGCLGDHIDHDPTTPGIQGQCTVEEVTYKFVWETRSVDVWVDPKTKKQVGDVGVVPGEEVAAKKLEAKTVKRKVENKVEAGRRPIPACPPEGEGGQAHGHHAMPCYELVENRHVCPAVRYKPNSTSLVDAQSGPAALVLYGDHQVRGRTIEIAASCEPAPPPPAEPTGDPGAEVVAAPHQGQVTFRTYHAPDKHEEQHEAANQPPPEHTNMFFSIYFAMTGLHGLHVLVGVFIFIWLLIRAIKGHFTPDYFGPIDYAALYWHLVDLIWIFLFPMLYLIH